MSESSSTPSINSGYSPRRMSSSTSRRGSRRLSYIQRESSTKRSSYTPQSDSMNRRLSSRSPSPPGSPTISASHIMGHVPQIPTVSLLTSLAGAAHYSGATSDEPAHESFRPTFADGEDRTKLDPVRQLILDDTLALFCAKPSPEIFQRHWRKDAIFEDPLCRCVGYRQYAAQWYGLAKVASSSRTLSHRVLASTSSPSRIVYSQTQEYHFRVTGIRKVVQSMVVIHLDNDNKITMLEDKWKGDDQPSNWGALFLRKLNAKALPLFIKYPKSPNPLSPTSTPASSPHTTYPPRSLSSPTPS